MPIKSLSRSPPGQFAGCLREDECDELFNRCTWSSVEAGELLFAVGDRRGILRHPQPLMYLHVARRADLSWLLTDILESTTRRMRPVRLIATSMLSEHDLLQKKSFSTTSYLREKASEISSSCEVRFQTFRTLTPQLRSYMSDVRTCSVRALTSATILRISQRDFKTFCTKVKLCCFSTSFYCQHVSIRMLSSSFSGSHWGACIACPSL